MASLSVFQPYVDKENTDAAGVRPKMRSNSVTGLGGKIFQGNTPVVPASRKALGDVKQNLALSVNGQGTRLTQKPQGLCPQQQLFKKPLQPRETPQSVKRPKIQVDSHRKQKPTVIPYIDKKQRAPQEKPDVLPDIERMEHYDPTEDEKPLKEIDFSGVISKLINWRPPCLFGSLPADSDEESDTEIDSNTISLAPLDLEFLEDDEIVLGEVPCEDVDLPSLIESFDIESSLGSLHLNSSTPVKYPV